MFVPFCNCNALAFHGPTTPLLLPKLLLSSHGSSTTVPDDAKSSLCGRRRCNGRRPAGHRIRSSSSLQAESNASDESRSGRTKKTTLFPGGFKRAEVNVPTLVLRLSPAEVLTPPDHDRILRLIDSAISRSVGIVWLEDDPEDGGGLHLYEAACTLKSLIRDRAFLLVAERVDIAAAVGASGVILSSKGLPAIVARNMMMNSISESVILPLVARIVDGPKSALSAASAEGADFLLLSTNNEKDAEAMASAVCRHVKVPVFIIIDFLREATLFSAASKLLQEGASGLVVSSADMKHFTNDSFIQLLSAAYIMKEGKKHEFQSSTKSVLLDRTDEGIKKSKSLDGQQKVIIEAERPVMQEAISVIYKAAPMMEEVSLLVDAVARLDQPLLLVIAGEFNSGKSTFINALLGGRYLREGVVPTTNEITLLRYSSSGANEQQRDERHPDGQFIRYLPAPILREMNLVDTPGTNVILQRQQRLTEEFVPRSDMLLFVISADRPLTESEVAFLHYVKQWKKRVVFILNKSDIYKNHHELEEAIMFIKDNARKLLNIEDVILYPVSSRASLEAKILASSDDGRINQFLLSCDPQWRSSRFDELEKFLMSFLDGSSDAGLERIKLKLETPVQIASTLLAACEAKLLEEREMTKQDFTRVKELVESVKKYTPKMETESVLWKKQILSLVDSTKSRVVKLVESKLQLSNIDTMATYVFKGRESDSLKLTSNVQMEVIDTALCDVRKLLEDYKAWLYSSGAREAEQFKEIFEKKCPSIPSALAPEMNQLFNKGEEYSIEIVTSFSASSAAKRFDQERRELVLGTVGGLGAAGFSASLLTSVLPTTMEDLLALALALCSAGGFFTISRFPSYRKELINKIEREANSLAGELEAAMQKDLTQSVENLESFVGYISRPYIDALQRRMNHLSNINEEIVEVGKKLKSLHVQIQNLHVP